MPEKKIQAGADRAVRNQLRFFYFVLTCWKCLCQDLFVNITLTSAQNSNTHLSLIYLAGVSIRSNVCFEIQLVTGVVTGFNSETTLLTLGLEPTTF